MDTIERGRLASFVKVARPQQPTHRPTIDIKLHLDRERASLGLNWPTSFIRDVWAFGPEMIGPNVLIDMRGDSTFQRHLIGQGLANGFQWATEEGVLAEEQSRGVRLNITRITASYPVSCSSRLCWF